MAGVTPATLRDLAAPTPPEEIKTRPAYGNTPALAYVDARFVQQRLDDVVGAENWQAEFETLPDPTAVRCRLGIYVDTGSAKDPEVRWVWKSDVGTASNIEPMKGAHSDAFKRAAVHWGIARDLYDDRAEAAGPRTAQAPNQQSQRPPVASRPPVAQQQYVPNPALQQAAGYVQPQVQTAGQPTPPWLCPMHQQVDVMPGTAIHGRNGSNGKPYDSFLKCPVQGCTQKPPRGTPVPPWMMEQMQQQRQQSAPPQYQQPPLPEPPAGQFYEQDNQDLPF